MNASINPGGSSPLLRIKDAAEDMADAAEEDQTP